MASAAVDNKQESGPGQQNDVVSVLKQLLIRSIFLDEMETFVIAIEKMKQMNIQLNWRAKLTEPLKDREDCFHSPLAYAVSLSRLSMVGILLANNADPNLCSLDRDKQSTGRTPLHQATKSRSLEMVDFLLQRGHCDVDKCDAQGWTAFNVAIALNEVDIAMKLLDFEANPKVYLTILSEDVVAAAVRYSIRSVLHRYDCYLTRPSQVQWNSLHLAAHCHQPEIVARLASEFFSKDDVNFQSSLGTTPLHEAVVLPEGYNTQDIAKSERRYKVVEILLQSGVKPNICDIKGRTALHLFFDEINSVKFVAKTNIKMIFETCQLVLKHDADPDVQDETGRTLSHQIAVFGNVDILKLLLDFGANCTLKDADGNTPAHLAAYHGQFELLSYLIQSGNFLAKEVNYIGDTVFHATMKAKKKDIKLTKVSLLLQKFFDVTCENVFGETVYDLVKKFHLEDVMRSSDTFGCDAGRRGLGLSSGKEQSKKDGNEGEPSLEGGEAFIEENPVGKADRRKGIALYKKLKLKIDEDTNVVDYLVELCEKNRMGEIHLNVDEFCHERCEIAKQTKSFVQELLSRVGDQDGRFTSNILCTGSAFEGYRISRPDEFDYMWEIVSLCDGACEVVHSATPGFVWVRVKEEQRADWEMFTSEDGLLDSMKIRTYLGEILEERSKSIGITKRFNLLFSRTSYDTCKFCQPLINLSKAGIKMAVIWNGIEYPMMLINIDVTPSIHFTGWPRSSKMPSTHLLANCEDVGYHVIPKSEGNDPLLWRLSFSKAELEILQSTNEVQGLCYTSLKILKDTTSGLSTGEFSHFGSLHTYVLKTKFIEELENTPDARSWSRNELVNRLCSIMESTARYISQRKSSVVESFFLPGYNVISIKDTMFSQIASASMKETLLRLIKLVIEC